MTEQKMSLQVISDAGLLAQFDCSSDDSIIVVAATPSAWARYRDVEGINSNEFKHKVAFMRLMSEILSHRVRDGWVKVRNDQIYGLKGWMGETPKTLGYWLFLLPDKKHAGVFLYSSEEADMDQVLEQGLRQKFADMIMDASEGKHSYVTTTAPKRHASQETLH